MTDETVKTLHYKRQFLAPEHNRYDEAACTSYVQVDSDPDGIEIEAEITISSGRQIINFDGTSHFVEHYDDHLVAMCKLRDQLIEYCSAYAEAVAIVRGQPVTRGGVDIVVEVNGSEATE